MRHLGTGAMLAATVFALSLTACSGYDVGPSLPVDVQIQSLKPTIGDAARCCCHVTGSVTNQSTVPVHVTIRFAAYGETGTEPFARILYFIRDMQPNEQQFFDASGLVFACADIGRVEIDDIDVTGVSFPAS